MKKEYVKPQAEQLFVAALNLMTASGEDNMPEVKEEDATEPAWAPRHSLSCFDDEDPEDDS